MAQESSLPLRRIALSCLGSIAKHDQTLADAVHKEGAITAAVGLLVNKDLLLRRQACRLLACSLQHEGAPAEWLPKDSRAQLVETLRVADPETFTFAAAVAQQLAKRSKTAASSLHDLGVVPLLVSHIASRSASPASAAAALGHICDAEPAAATVALEVGAIDAIKPILSSHAPVHICAVMCAALGGIAAADEKSAAAVAQSGCIELMAEATLLSKRTMGTAARSVTRKGISKALSKCNEYSAMVFLIEALPLRGSEADALVLASLFKALARLLNAKGALRLDFMKRGALTLAQSAAKSSSGEVREALKSLNATFPAQMVAATDPDYEQKLLDKIS
jgi:hypothetical protein